MDLHYDACFYDYYDVRDPRDDWTTHVAWSIDDLPELAADIHRTVLALVVHGAPCADVDAAIIDRLRGTTTRADDGVAHPAGHG